MQPTLAQVTMFGGNFAPRSWALCNGQILPINSNQSLFSLLGTTYGGDGRTTFALPELRGRTPIHAGHGPGLSDRKLGAKSGSETNTITQAQMAAHDHVYIPTISGEATLGVNEEGQDSSNPTTGTFTEVSMYHSGGVTANYSGVSHNLSLPAGNTNPTGANTPVNNMQPYTVINFIIALQGIFPSRN